MPYVMSVNSIYLFVVEESSHSERNVFSHNIHFVYFHIKQVFIFLSKEKSKPN